jgi:5,10-methylenetetrahydromethanopterin reductase
VGRLLSSVEDPYSGSVFHVESNVRLPYPIYRSDVPILIGTWGHKLGAIAGQLADEVKLGGCANPAMIPVMQRWIAEGEQQAGRPPGSVGVVVGAVTVVDLDSRSAKDLVKRALALYLPVVAGLDVTVAIDPDLLARIGALVDAHQIDQAGDSISDDLLAKFTLAGSPEEVLTQTQTLFEAGARRVEYGTSGHRMVSGSWGSA